MRTSGIAFHIQQRVGYACFITTFCIASANLLIGMFQHKIDFPIVLLDTSVWLLYLFSLFGILTAFRDSAIFRAVHVIIFMGTSIFTTIVLEIGSLHGILFFVFGALLALQYGFFKRYFWLKASALIVAYLAAIIVAVAIQDGYSIPSGIPTLLLTGMMVFLFWTIFSEEIKSIRSRTSNLQQELDRNQVFVKFGRDVAGVVHNLRSTLMSVEGYNDHMRNTIGEDPTECLSLQKDATDRMIDMVENFMVAVRSYQRVDSELVNLSQIVRSAVELIQGNQEIKHTTHFDCNVPHDLVAYISPLELMQVLDNLLMNAHESFNGQGWIRIVGRSEDSLSVIEIEDTGGGISWCSGCDRDDCLHCGEFTVGKTTKQNGTGLGFNYVQEVIQRSNGSLAVTSATGAKTGTKIAVKLPCNAITV